ncbi:ergothioneine biosynthesis protein EgtB [Bradyrhizobium sp. AZCC 1578]
MTKPVSAAAFAAPAPSLFSDSGALAQNLVEAYLAVRGETERRAAPLSPEDQLIQSMPDASPAKWHRAHTTWFFEQFLLGEHCEGYQPFHPDYAFLFNSYYVSAGPRHARHQRGHLTRPSADEITAYRRHVDAAVVKFFQTAGEERLTKLVPLVEVGLNHEQQHQELMLTDILHAFAQNPIPPAYDPSWRLPTARRSAEEWTPLNEGIHTVGHADDSFHFDNEKPAHRALVGPVRLARNLVTNAEWLAFMQDGGYGTATLWLMDGFATATNEGWQAPGHWRQVDGEWRIMTLGGLQPIDPAAPVCHVSYYEADAFARWAGCHLPTEMEWEGGGGGRSPPAPASSTMPLASSGSGLAVPTPPTPATAPSRGRSGNTTASSWSTSSCCAAPRLQLRPAIAVSPTATSSTRTTAGNSRGYASPITPDIFDHRSAPESAFRRVS